MQRQKRQAAHGRSWKIALIFDARDICFSCVTHVLLSLRIDPSQFSPPVQFAPDFKARNGAPVMRRVRIKAKPVDAQDLAPEPRLQIVGLY